MAEQHDHLDRAAHSGIHKKAGPLETWQWAALGVALGLVVYLIRRRPDSTNASSTTSPTDAALVPDDTQGDTSTAGDGGTIDPTTGDTGATDTDTTTGNPTLEQELGDLGSIEQLMSGLSDIGGSGQTGDVPAATTPIASTMPARIANGANRRRTSTKSGGKKNPGHTVTTHHTGKKSASSTHHDAGQRNTHKTVAKPSHQRASATKAAHAPKQQPMRHLAPETSVHTPPPPHRAPAAGAPPRKEKRR